MIDKKTLQNIYKLQKEIGLYKLKNNIKSNIFIDFLEAKKKLVKASKSDG